MMTTTVNHPSINKILNDIHRWGEADQHPMSRMFLTRLGGVACGGIELAATTTAIARLGIVAIQNIGTLAAMAAHRAFPKSERLARFVEHGTREIGIKDAFFDLCHLVAGVSSTLFIGIIFSPEINFRLHLSLGLATNDLSARRERETASRLLAEKIRAEVMQAREERFSRFIELRNAQKKEEERRNRFDGRLAELL